MSKSSIQYYIRTIKYLNVNNVILYTINVRLVTVACSCKENRKTKKALNKVRILDKKNTDKL